MARPRRRIDASCRRLWRSFLGAQALAAAALLTVLPGFAHAHQQGPDPADLVKEIVLEGNEITRDYVILRELTTRVGEPLDEERLEEDLQLLDRLDIFAEIRLTYTREPDGVVVKVWVRETHPWVPMVSVQINDENGVSAGGGAKFGNIAGKDISGGFRVLFGGATIGEFALNNPWVAGNHFSYDAEYFYRQRNNVTNGFFETSNEVDTTLQSWIHQDGRIGGRFTFIDMKSDTDGKTLEPDNRDRILDLAAFVGLDSRDLISNTRDGWWNEIELRKNGVLGPTDFWQVAADLRRYFPVGTKHAFVLFSMLQWRTGQIGQEIAPWQTFYIGGTNTVRGWDNGARSGKNELINTVEYRYTILEPRGIRLPVIKIMYRGGVHVAAFADVGTAWSASREFSMANTIAGAGVGLRLMVPFIGIIRFDVGMGQDGKVRLHLAAFEKPVMTRKRVR